MKEVLAAASKKSGMKEEDINKLSNINEMSKY